MIRNAAKAVIVRDECLLLLRSVAPNGDVFFELPGGGQNEYETMEETVLRECLEETGFTVAIDRFLFVSEDIISGDSYRARYPGHVHRVFHVFLCRLTDAPQAAPTEVDDMQTEMVWVPISSLPGMNTRPFLLADRLPALLQEGGAGYLGATRFHYDKAL